MNPDNRWVRKAELIPWDEIEENYAELFHSKTGMPAKPLRMALGSLRYNMAGRNTRYVQNHNRSKEKNH